MNDDEYGKNIVLDHNWLAQFSTGRTGTDHFDHFQQSHHHVKWQ